MSRVFRRPIIFIFMVLVIAIHVGHAQEVPENYANNATSVHWIQKETPHFKLVFPRRYVKSFSGTGDVAEKIYQEYKEVLGIEPDHKITLYFNDEDEVTSAARALHTDASKSLWKDNIYRQNTAADQQSFNDMLRYEIAYNFQKIVQHFPVDYYYLLISRHYKTPWSDALPSYLSVPQILPEDVSRMRNYWFTQQVDTNGIYWSKKAKNWILGRSQIHYFGTKITPDSLKTLYRYRQTFAGLFHYFNFSPAFKQAAGISYDDFSSLWQKQGLKKYRKEEAQADTIGRGEKYQSLTQLSKVHEYVGIKVSDSGKDIAVITRPFKGWRLQNLTVLPDSDRPVKIDDGSFHPVMDWQPGGDKLVYSKELLGGKGNFHNELFAFGESRRKAQRLTQNEHATLPSFSYDGRRLAYVSSKNNENTIKVKSMSSGEEHAAITLGKNVTIGLLDWHSRQGLLLVSYRNEQGVYKMGLLDLKRQVFSIFDIAGRVPLNARWGSSDSKIYFDGLKEEVPNIFTAGLKGTSVVNIKPLTTAFQGVELQDVYSDSSGSLRVLGKTPGPFGRDMIETYPAEAAAGGKAAKAFMRSQGNEKPGSILSSGEESPFKNDISTTAYRSFSNIKMGLFFPTPYYISPGDFGLLGYLKFDEPLRKQSFEYLGTLSLAAPLRKSFFHTSYINNMFRPRLELDYDHFPAASEWFKTSRKTETIDVLGLRSLWKLTGLSHNYNAWYAGLTLRYLAIDYLPDSTLNKHHPGIHYENTKTRQTDLRLSLTWRNLKPYRHTIIHPLQAEGMRLQVGGSEKILGSQARYLRLGLDGYAVLPAIGKQRIYVYANGALDIGDPIGRAYLGLSDNGTYRLPGPDFSGKVNPGFDYFTRGYSTTILGKKILFGTLEYRIPLMFDTDKKWLGVLPPSRTVLAFFADAGILGDARVAKDTVTTLYRYSAGVEIKRVFAIGSSFKFVYELGLGQPLNKKLAPKPYVNLRTAIPF